jgi:hypothetical protein
LNEPATADEGTKFPPPTLIFIPRQADEINKKAFIMNILKAGTFPTELIWR